MPNDHDLANAPLRTALITGGTSGLGLACARALLRSREHKWQLLLASRRRIEGETAAASLNRDAGRPAAEFIALDLGSMGSIRDTAKALLKRESKLDALVCNAGVQFASGDTRTTEGFEVTFGVNHLGHFLLLQCLIPLLNDNARILVVSSSTHDPKQRTGMPAPRFVSPEFLAKPELDQNKVFAAADTANIVIRRRYTTSKLCNVMFCYELNRRIHKSGGELPIPASVTANIFDPGLMPGTQLGRDFQGMQRFVWKRILPLMRPLLQRMIGNVHTPASSGAALAQLIDSSLYTGVSGEYFEGTKAVRSSEESYRGDLWTILWEQSERLVAVTPSARPL